MKNGVRAVRATLLEKTENTKSKEKQYRLISLRKTGVLKVNAAVNMEMKRTQR